MNIAIYYSGRIDHQLYYKNKVNLKTLSDKYNLTHFCSLNKDANSHEFIEEFSKDFNIKDDQLNIEITDVPNDIKNTRLYVNGNLYNMHSMFYHNYKCMELIKNYQQKHNIKFDIIIKYRADIYSDNILNLDKPDKNTIYIPDRYNYGGINDQIAYGDFTSMEIYSECYLNFLNCAKSCNKFHPETILSHHLKTKNLNISPFKYEYILKKY
jgi:hypothetical protein